MSIPLIDERVKYVGVSYLRSLNAKTLAALTDVLVVQVDEEPTAVIIPYSIYLEIQQALWPASIIPSLEEAFDVSENGGVNANPDMEHSMDSYREAVPIHRSSVDGGVLCDGWVKGTPYVETENPALVTCATCRYDRLSETPCEVTVIGVTPEPRGAKFSRVDPNADPVIDDIDEPPTSEAATISIAEARAVEKVIKRIAEDEGLGWEPPKNPICDHCHNPSDKSLCPSCFMSGHRDGNCLACVEGAK